MKKLLLPLLAVLLFTACQKQITIEKVSEEKSSVSSQSKGTKIDVCHHDVVTNTWSMKSINPNALPGHLAHGDIVPDADGDGYSKTTPCGTGNDCDDNNAAINPGATEICGNNIDDNCNGQIDENCIPSVTICNQTWMVKNLDVDKYSDGTLIPEVQDPSAWAALTTGAWCYYENNSANGTVYGKLYNWYAVNDFRGLAPTGWHIPTDVEWSTLSTCLDAVSPTGNVGGKMKTTGTIEATTGLWHVPNTDATNSSGFRGLPGGYRFFTGPFTNIGNFGMWWCSNEGGTGGAWYSYLGFNVGDLLWFDFGIKPNGFSVRCVRD